MNNKDSGLLPKKMAFHRIMTIQIRQTVHEDTDEYCCAAFYVYFSQRIRVYFTAFLWCHFSRLSGVFPGVFQVHLVSPLWSLSGCLFSPGVFSMKSFLLSIFSRCNRVEKTCSIRKANNCSPNPLSQFIPRHTGTFPGIPESDRNNNHHGD